MTKKVLFLITKSNWGGAQRYVYDLATTLNPAEFDPVVACGGNGTLVDMLHHAHIRTIVIESLKRDVNSTQDWAFATELYRLIKQEKPDVLHLNSSKASAIGAVVGRLAGVPKIIFTTHGWAFNEDRPFWQRLVIKFIYWLTILLSSHTIAVSNGTAKEMNWPLVKNKITVVNPGRKIGAMFPRDEARETLLHFFPVLAPCQNDTWVVTVAELHPIKRHLVLFQAFRTLTATKPNLRLICFGEGELRDELQAWVNDHGLQNNIFILGNLPEAARFLKAFDLFVLASKSESYGYVLHEAGLARIPIVATKVGGIMDIVTDQITGRLVPPDNTAKLTEAIYQSLNNETVTTTRTETLQKILSERTTTQMTEAIVAIYKI